MTVLKKQDRINYSGNPNLKKIGVQFEYTEDQIVELAKCAEDPIYFLENYGYIVTLDHGIQPFKLWDFQKDFVKIIHNNRMVAALLPRQSSKTQLSVGYILWYTLFQSNKTVAIVANKDETAREVLSRYQLMYEHVPLWMQQGLNSWNKGSLELENGSKIFTAATSASGLRGRSCVTGDTKICICNGDDIYYGEISFFINNSRFTEIKDSTKMKYTVYKTTNKVNNKIYIGFHQIADDLILCEKAETGSVFKDNYLGSGKILKLAVEKYGPDSFYQELLGVFDTREEAEQLEKTLVNKEFTLDKNTYNMSIGGNVLILYGENSGFYGKHHTEERKQEISKLHSGNKYFSNAKNVKIRNVKTGVVYLDFIELTQNENVTTRRRLINLIGEGAYEYLDKERQQQALNLYNSRLTKEEKSKLLAEKARKTFSGKPLSKNQKNKIGIGVKNFIKNNPEKHQERMLKINKNPEKIEKTANKHRGMKRSQETCKKISESIKGLPSSIKGKIAAYHKETKEVKYFNDIFEIPENFIKGSVSAGIKRGVAYNNGLIVKIYKDTDEIPAGFIRGALPKPRKPI
jgi:hypothetical protein